MNKYPYFTNEVKENFISNKIINEAKQKNGEDDFFKYFFIKLFDIDFLEKNFDINKIDLSYISQKREYTTKTQLKIDFFDLSQRSFYEIDDKFLINNQDIYGTDENIPKEIYTVAKLTYKTIEFEILIHLWNSWKDDDNTQFYIFFGFNKF